MLHNCWKYGALRLANCSQITNNHALFGQQDSLDWAVVRGKRRVFSARLTQLAAQAQHNSHKSLQVRDDKKRTNLTDLDSRTVTD